MVLAPSSLLLFPLSESDLSHVPLDAIQDALHTPAAQATPRCMLHHPQSAYYELA